MARLDEAHLPAQEPKARARSRVPGAHEDARRSGDPQTPPPQGPQAVDAVAMTRNGGEARKRGRLSRSGDFERAYREGSSEANRHLILYAFPRAGEEQTGGTRLGISVGRKVGGAVERNRVKRALRECFWAATGEGRTEQDVVIVARPGVLELLEGDEPGALCESLQELLGATGVVSGPRA